MIKINSEYLDKYANEHYEGLKCKLPLEDRDFLKGVITAKPEKLEEIATSAKAKNYEFMINKYNNFATKKKEYNAYDLAKKLNINVCPYCNINSTYTIIGRYDEGITRPEFDHFYDKKTYPILALSFYNLIPSCHTCNSSLKGSKDFSKEAHINPYSHSFNNVAKFNLKIKNSSFYHSMDGFEIKLNSKDEKAKNNIKTFKLDTMYQNHKDIVLELIKKQIVYNESYIDELYQNYEGTLFKNREDVLRLISGGYMEDKDISKRPLSKLIKDVSEDLELL